MPIPYYSRVDKRLRRYFPDFWVMIKTKDGTVKRIIIEIKPMAQVKKPCSRKRDKLLKEMATWIINQDKWNAAKAWAEKNGWEFTIFTEYELGIKK